MFDGFLNADSDIFLLIGALIVGFIVIIIGGDKFVDSAIWIAVKTKMPKMLIGATLVSVGTTLPEMFASFTAASQGETSIAIGNGLGSILCNSALVLAITLSARPGNVSRKSFYPKFSILMVAVVLALVFALNGVIELWQCIILFSLAIVYLVYNVIDAKRQSKQVGDIAVDQQEDEYDKYNNKKAWVMILLFVLGTAGIAVGANLLVSSVKGICAQLGVSEAVIALTVVAIGTSLPELVTALTSIKKNSADISIGNILGANVINATLLMGVCGFFPDKATGQLGLFLPPADFVTTLVTIGGIVAVWLLIGLPILIKQKTYRYQGIISLVMYAGYVTYLMFQLTK